MEYHRDVGGCCGTYVLCGFGMNPTEERVSEMKRLMDGREADVRNRNRDVALLVEPGANRYVPNPQNRGRLRANVLTVAYLTDQQMAGWANVLREMGFRLVTRYFNSNSGNNVNILHHSLTRESRRNADLPFEWPAQRRRG